MVLKKYKEWALITAWSLFITLLVVEIMARHYSRQLFKDADDLRKALRLYAKSLSGRRQG